jgi:hypothetical protein
VKEETECLTFNSNLYEQFIDKNRKNDFPGGKKKPEMGKHLRLKQQIIKN